MLPFTQTVMSIRLSLVNMYLRRLVRPQLAKIAEPEKARAHMRRSASMLPGQPRDVRYLVDQVTGPGGIIPVEWVSSGRADRWRIVLYLHGGAYLMGSPQTHRSITAQLARRTGMRVMVPDYRLAPEHPAPAAAEDALAAYTALLSQGYKAEEIAISGESAGGGLCFAMLVLAKAKGYPMPGCVVAFSPWLDLTHSGDSITTNAAIEAMLPAERVHEVAAFYIGDGRADDPVISPLFAEWVDPLPMLIEASNAEILRDDSVRMADKLRESGGDVTLELLDDAPHAWQFFAPILPEANESLERAARFIREKIGGPREIAVRTP